MTKAVWMSYDLGVKGDYQGLYAWLDDHNAIECGNSIAFFHYPVNEELINELKQDLLASINFKPGDRIYIIRKDIKDNKTRGTFIIGKRKSNPWEGYGSAPDNSVDGDE